MTSSSTLSNSSITVQFDLNRNIDAAAQDVLTAINAAGGQLPKTLPSPPTYRKTLCSKPAPNERGASGLEQLAVGAYVNTPLPVPAEVRA